MDTPAAELGKLPLGADAEPQELRTRCAHSEKYEISTTGEPVSQFPYPSRLGFIYSAASGVSIRYVDLNKKLCRDCCDAIVPGGQYYAWSILAGTNASDVGSVLARLNPSDAFYPPILQAGKESEAVVHPIPDFPGAKEVWQWLEARGKPFYIDQLHLPVGYGMTPLARKRVAKDSAVALRYGEVVTSDLIRESSKLKFQEALGTVAQSGNPPKSKTASEKRPSKKTSTKASRKDLTARDVSEIELLPEASSEKLPRLQSPTEKPESATHDPKTAKPLTGKSSTKRAKVHETEPEPRSTTKTTSKSTVKRLDPSSVINLTPTTMTVSKQLTSTASIPMTTSMATRTFTRSWGWSEPFEFATTGRKVPALRDYERVAEARVLKEPETKSLAHFLQERLELEAAPKLRGPGDIDEVTHAALVKDSSTKVKESASLLPKKSKASSSTNNAKESSAEKSTKNSEAHRKSKELSSGAKLSSSSKDVKAVEPHEKSSKQSKEKASHHGKQLQSEPSSKVTDPAVGKVKQKHASTQGSNSKSRTHEIHSTTISTKETSHGPGSLGGVWKAGLSYAEHKLRDAATKPSEGKKHKQRQPSDSKPRPHVRPHHHRSDSSGSEDSAHTGAKPPKPNRTEQPESNQPSTQADYTVDGQPPSQVDKPVQPGPPAVTDTTGQLGPSDQSPIFVQTDTSSFANIPPQTASSPLTGAGTTPGELFSTPADPTDLPPTASGWPTVQHGTGQLNDADEGQTIWNNSTWPGVHNQIGPESQPIQSVQVAAEGHGPSYVLSGPRPLPNDTGVYTSVGRTGHVDFNNSATASLSRKPIEEAVQNQQPESLSSKAEVGGHPSPSAETVARNGKDHASVDAIQIKSDKGLNNRSDSNFDTVQASTEPVAHESGNATPGSSTGFSGPGVANQPWKGEAPSDCDTKQGITSRTYAGISGRGYMRILEGDPTRSKKLGGEAAPRSQNYGKHKLQSHDRKPDFAKPSKGGIRKPNGHAGGVTAGLAGLAVGATVGYASAEILMERDSDSSSGSQSDNDNNGTPSQEENSDDSDFIAGDSGASQSGEDGSSDNGSIDGESEIGVGSDIGSDHDGSTEVSEAGSDSDNEDNDIDGPTEDENSEVESSDSEQDSGQDSDHEDDGSQGSQSEDSSDEENGTEEDANGQESSGAEDGASSGNEESSLDDNDSDIEDEASEIEDNEESGQEFSDPEDSGSDY